MVGKMIWILNLIVGAVVLLFPGLLLSFLLYPEPESLDFLERIASSLGLSALIDMIIVVILAQSALRALQIVPVLGTIFAFCGICGILIFLNEESRETFLDFWRTPEV